MEGAGAGAGKQSVKHAEWVPPSPHLKWSCITEGDNDTHSSPLVDAFVVFPALSSNFMAHKSWAKLCKREIID